jgi:hypothetical protein
MRIAGKKLLAIQEALLHAFPTRSDLAQMLRFRMDVLLDEVTGGLTMRELVFNLLTWAESHSRLDDLVDAAHRHVPDDSHLAALKKSLGCQKVAGACTLFLMCDMESAVW